MSMLHFVEHSKEAEPRGEVVEISMTHEQRRRSRLRVVLADGREAGIFLARGSVLRDGDLLRSEEGTLARVRAAPELVSLATTGDLQLLARAAYHLGNRHVALQIESTRVIYPHDHVLDGMCRELGLLVDAATRPFEPELGGYTAEHRHVVRTPHAFGPVGPRRHG